MKVRVMQTSMNGVDTGRPGQVRGFISLPHDVPDSTILCVLTRFGLQSALALPRFALAFRRIHRDARQIPGFIQATFLIESPRVCYSVSIWADEQAIGQFGACVQSHVTAANRFLKHVFRKDVNRLELWSVHWRLKRVSNNLNWRDMDWRTIIATHVREQSVSCELKS
jgi:hypothetical protein